MAGGAARRVQRPADAGPRVFGRPMRALAAARTALRRRTAAALRGRRTSSAWACSVEPQGGRGGGCVAGATQRGDGSTGKHAFNTTAIHSCEAECRRPMPGHKNTNTILDARAAHPVIDHNSDGETTVSSATDVARARAISMSFGALAPGTR